MDRIDAWLEETGRGLGSLHRPIVSLCYAQSLDGSLAVRHGEPVTLSGPESQILTHRLRAAHDAILVGIGTVLADDPQLTVRLAGGKNPQPVVLDSHLRMPLEAGLLRHHPLKPWIATTQLVDPQCFSELRSAGARLILCASDTHGRVDLADLLHTLSEMNIGTLMVEGGASVLTSFLGMCLADRVIMTVAPRFLGGLPAIAPGSFAAASPMVQAGYPRLNRVEYEQCGEDLTVWGEIDYGR